jgi:16S rRNA processing protein RimM
MNIQDCFKIGYIQKPHALKGEVTVLLEPDLPFDFGEIPSLFLDLNNNLVPHSIEAVSINGTRAIVKFEDIDSHAAANAICKRHIYVPKSTRPRSGRGQFYDDEVIGFEVEDEAHGILGNVATVVHAGLNRLLSVEGGGREILIPLNSPFITSINKAEKRISVSLPDGYLEM